MQIICLCDVRVGDFLRQPLIRGLCFFVVCDAFTDLVALNDVPGMTGFIFSFGS